MIKKIFAITALTLGFSINAQVGNTTIESVLGQTFSQNNEFDESKYLLVDNSATLSMKSSPFKNAAKPFIEHNITSTQASTKGTSNLKPDRNDAWFINKTTHNKITNQSYQKSLKENASGNAAVPIKRSAKGIENTCVSSESFETFPLKGWTIINSDAPANDIVQSSTWASEGSYSLKLSNFYGSPTINQYIISPELVTTESDRYMKFFPKNSGDPQKYRVGWSSTGTDVTTDFTWGAITVANYNSLAYEKTDLPVGTKYIIIEHIDTGSWGWLYIDDFCLPQLAPDTTVPIIALVGANLVTVEAGTTYTDEGATASDTYDGDISSSIAVTGIVDTSIAGDYTVFYNVSDPAGNAATQITRTVYVRDTTIPVITLLGANSIIIEAGITYTDAGAAASDTYDGNISSNIAVTSNVDTAIIGDYTVFYNVSDAAENAAVTVTRSVKVVDTTVPIINLSGANSVTIEAGTTYTDAGATASDTYDGNISSSIAVTSNVDTAIIGDYTVSYNVSDASYNAAVTVTRSVKVAPDTTMPEIALVGDNSIIIEAGTTYNDAGATASDTFDGNISSNIVVNSTVDTSIIGDYTVTYNVSDASGNAAVTVTRSVKVADTTVPIISLLGFNSITIEAGTAYTDAGAIASDTYDGNISSNIALTNSVNTAIIGDYTVSYNVSDAAGNAAVTVTRLVKVVDADASQSSTEITSYLKPYGTDTWLINKTTNNAITIQSYPLSVNRLGLLNNGYLNIIKPDGSYLVQQHKNHSKYGTTVFYQIQADDPLGEYKVEMSVLSNFKGGYRLNCLSDSSYLNITADNSIAPITETHVFKNTAGNEWDITKNESFSIGNDVHEWSLPLTEGENLVIDLYSIAPWVLNSLNLANYDSMDTMLYVLDANNNVVASNDDRGRNKNAKIYYTVPASGDYKVIATNYGVFSGINWSVDPNAQDAQWGLGTTGIMYYALNIKSSPLSTFAFEAFALQNPAAIKINAILLTDDENLVDVPVTTAHIQNLIAGLNTEYNNLYNASYWPGFELAVITKFYNKEHATTGNPDAVLSELGSSLAAKQNYLNLIFTEIDFNLSGTVGVTYTYSNVTKPNGATIVLDDKDANSTVLIHEMGHVTGMKHIAGLRPTSVNSLTLQDNTMGYTSNYISRPENSAMSNWNSKTFNSEPNISLYLTNQPRTLKTTSYGDLFSEAFRSWLITNNYINADAPGTGYEGNDISKSVSNSWVNPETIAASSSVFSSIASSKNAENNHAAYAVGTANNTQLYYGFRNTDNSWTHNNYTTNTYRNYVDMNSNGDAVIIVEPARFDEQLTVIYKAHDQNAWSAPQVISESEKYAMRPNVEINNNGDVAVVWLDINSQEDSSIKFREMVNGSWTSEETLSNSLNVKELPSLAYTNNGDVLVTWQEWNINNSQRFDVVGKFRNGTTQSWGALETFSDASNHAGFSQVAMDSSGDAIVYWRQATGTFVANKADNPVGELNVRFRNYDGTLENIVTVSPTGEDSLNAATESTEPRIVFEDGRAAVTWWGVNEAHNVVYASIMANKTTWNTTALTDNGKNSDLSSISMGNNGFIAVAWQRTDGLHQRIQSKFYNASTSSWSAVMTMSDSGSDAIHADIAADDTYSATASWVRWNAAAKKYVPEIKQYTPIVITLLGENPVTLEAGTSYVESGATAINSSGVDVSANIQMTGTVNASVVGTYTINYNATDSEGNVGTTMTRTVHIEDTTLPIITLVGDTSIIVEVGSTYSDAGATASDTFDGNISSTIVVSSTVDTSIAGDYTVTYNVSDASSNAAVTVTRSVKVTPICVSSEGFETFPPKGWTIINSDAPVNDIVQSDAWSSEGSYSLKLSNFYGSPTINQYIISPELVTTESDRYMKFIPKNSGDSQKYRVGWSSTGTNLDDFTWGAIRVANSNSPEYEKTDLPVGTKYIIIEHIDTRSWGWLYIDDFCLPQLAPDTTVPIIELVGANSVTVEAGTIYTDAGATASDTHDGDIYSNIVVSSNVETSIPGNYTVTYNVSDAAGNAAVTVTRLVKVVACVSSEGFEETFPPKGWTIINSDVPSNDIVQSNTWASRGSYSLRFFNAYGSPTVNQYIISPELVTTESDRYMKFSTFSHEAAGTSGYTEKYRVGWSSTGRDVATDFTWGAIKKDGYDSAKYEKSNLPVGTKYIIIEHIRGSSFRRLYIDDFCLPQLVQKISTWYGAVDNNYNNPANWSSNTVPTINNDIIIPPGAAIDLSGDLNVNSMSISDGASLISDGTITGLISYTRTIPTTNWYLISSPLVGQDKDAFVTASNLATGTGNNVGFADYDNSTKAWSYYQSGASGTGNFLSGEGHAVKLNTAGDVVFTGAFNDADARFTLSYNTNGFNLIGNPYLASVSVKEMLEEVNIETLLSEKTVWLWDQASESYSQKNIIDDLEIAPGQAFFVSAAQTGDFSINESMQSHSSDTFQKTTTRPEVALTLSNGELSRTASVFYIDGATTGFDNGYDSSLFKGFANKFSIFTHVVANGSGRNLGTQSLPDNNFENMIIPVGVIAEPSSALEFSARLENLPEDVKVFLEDKEENTFTRLDALNASYKITTTSIINGVGRFYLHTAKSVLSIPDATLDNVSIFKVHNSLRITGLSQGKSTFKLFDVLGRQVVHTTFESNGVHDITLPKLPAGIYIVQLENEAGKLNKKIVLD